MRLINVDALKIHNVDLEHGCTVVDYALALIKSVSEATTIDAEPVRHGRWLLGVSAKPLCISACKCSECGRFIYPGVRLPEITRKYLLENFPYCHCGAKMDGGCE